MRHLTGRQAVTSVVENAAIPRAGNQYGNGIQQQALAVSSVSLHLQCGDRLSAVLHQVAELVNFPALVIKPKGRRPEGGLWGCTRLPIGHKPWLQRLGGYRRADGR